MQAVHLGTELGDLLLQQRGILGGGQALGHGMMAGGVALGWRGACLGGDRRD